MKGHRYPFHYSPRYSSSLLFLPYFEFIMYLFCRPNFNSYLRYVATRFFWKQKQNFYSWLCVKGKKIDLVYKIRTLKVKKKTVGCKNKFSHGTSKNLKYYTVIDLSRVLGCIPYGHTIPKSLYFIKKSQVGVSFDAIYKIYHVIPTGRLKKNSHSIPFCLYAYTHNYIYIDPNEPARIQCLVFLPSFLFFCRYVR